MGLGDTRSAAGGLTVNVPVSQRERQVQRGSVTCPKTHSKEVAEMEVQRYTPGPLDLCKGWGVICRFTQKVAPCNVTGRNARASKCCIYRSRVWERRSDFSRILCPLKHIGDTCLVLRK